MTEEMNPTRCQNKSSEKTNFFLGFFSGMALLAVVAFFVLLIIVFSGKQPVDLGAAANTDDPAQTAEPTVKDVPPMSDNDYVYGNRDAKVVLIEYTDFECPFCAKHYDTAKAIKKAYGDKIAFVARNFPLSFHQEAQKAAEASKCAGEQGKFWEMYDKLFEANKAGTMGVDKWKAEAKKLGLDTAKFNDCLDSGKYTDIIAAEAAAAAAAGVDGTPATFINGELISGALPFEQFKGVIDGLLAK